MKKIPYTKILIGSITLYFTIALTTLIINWNAYSWEGYKKSSDIVIQRKIFRMPHFHVQEGDTFKITSSSGTIYLHSVRTIKSATISARRVVFTATDSTRHIVEL